MINIRQFDFATPEYDQSIVLRDAILRKPLNLSFQVSDLEKEYDSIHLGAFNQLNQIIGCLVLKPLADGNYKMRQVAVAQEVQGNGVGSMLVKASESLLKRLSAKSIELNARDVAIPFYLKLDYKKVGREFEEVGIKHFRMEKKLK